MQAEDGQTIMSSSLAKRQHVDDIADLNVSKVPEQGYDTAYMQVSRSGTPIWAFKLNLHNNKGKP